MPTGISWTDETWVPLTGCTRVSPACDSCYAFTLHDQRHVAWKSGRLPTAAPQYHKPFSQVQLLRERLVQPLRWQKPKKIFLTSMGDVFHPDVPDGYITDLWRIMAHAPWHIFQVLTKRPERMRAWMARWCDRHEDLEPLMVCGPDAVRAAHTAGRAHLFADMIEGWGEPPSPTAYPSYDWMEGMRWWPSVFPHVWLGTTVEDQARAAERLPELLATPAVAHWISAEPLLGPVDLSPWHLRPDSPASPRLDWVVVGGESGPRCREMDLRWLESIVQQCRDQGVAIWVKQDSGRLPGKQGRIPDELWIHEFPYQAVLM